MLGVGGGVFVCAYFTRPSRKVSLYIGLIFHPFDVLQDLCYVMEPLLATVEPLDDDSLNCNVLFKTLLCIITM